jgi:hypothetical protein
MDESRHTERSRVIATSDVHCQHISSIHVWNGTGGIEFGYVIGYSNCPGYTGTYYHDPKPFYFAFNSSGFFVGCRVWTGRSLEQASLQTFRVSDTNGNYHWGSWLDGEELQPDGVMLDFNQGKNGLGMERGNPGDDGFSRFEKVSEYHPNSPGDGWSRLDDLRLLRDTDPKYKFDVVNEYTGRMILQ